MGIVFGVIIGGVAGWLASLIMKTDNQMGIIINVIVGIVGAIIGSWLFGTVLGFGSALTAGSFSLLGLFWAILGAVILIGFLKMLKLLK